MEYQPESGPSRPEEGNVSDIVRMAAKKLSEENQEAFDALMSLANEGALEEHQTDGRLNAIADELLEARKEGGDED
jgi:hypothetical protein